MKILICGGRRLQPVNRHHNDDIPITIQQTHTDTLHLVSFLGCYRWTKWKQHIEWLLKCKQSVCVHRKIIVLPNSQGGSTSSSTSSMNDPFHNYHHIIPLSRNVYPWTLFYSKSPVQSLDQSRPYKGKHSHLVMVFKQHKHNHNTGRSRYILYYEDITVYCTGDIGIIVTIKRCILPRETCITGRLPEHTWCTYYLHTTTPSERIKITHKQYQQSSMRSLYRH